MTSDSEIRIQTFWILEIFEFCCIFALVQYSVSPGLRRKRKAAKESSQANREFSNVLRRCGGLHSIRARFPLSGQVYDLHFFFQTLKIKMRNSSKVFEIRIFCVQSEILINLKCVRLRHSATYDITIIITSYQFDTF